MARSFLDSTLPPLHRLSPEKVQEVIDDLNLLQDDAVVYFAVDPYEIAEFCFPVNPDSFKPLEIDEIADDQAAFHEIFYGRKRKPLLFPEYVKELRGILAFFDHQLGIAYTRAEILQELIRAGELPRIVNEKKKIYEDIAEDYFNVLLAVARGFYSVGVDRFRDIFHRQLLTYNLEPNDTPDAFTLARIFTAYKETDLKLLIFRAVKSSLKNPNESPVEKERRHRSLLVDAGAVDRALYLNSALEQAYLTGELTKRYIILYLSSALRTQKIFDLPEVQKALPQIAGRTFSPWRTRRQVFAYVVHRSNNSHPLQQLQESIRNLNRLKDVLSEVRRLKRNIHFQCGECLLVGKTPSECALVDFCENVKALYEDIQRTRGQIQNLGLINTLGEDFRRLTETRKQTNDKTSQFQSYLDLFQDVCNSGVKDVARDKMQQKQRWIMIYSEATNLFKEGFTIGKEDTHTFRTPTDSITGVDQILPTKPQLKSGKYSSILNSILNYYRNPNPEQFDLLEEAYKEYLKVDPGNEKRDPEQELINCYLYLAFGRGQSERKAYEYAKALVSDFDLSADGSSMQQEYRYVLLWAARRQGEFRVAEECARTAIINWPDDPRFYHGRCLNTYSWIMHEKYAGECPLTIKDAIQDAQKAIELYSKTKRKNRDVIAANYNNLAYFLAMQVTALDSAGAENAQKLLEYARNALDDLKRHLKKESWSPDHPEYFHTEAYVEYQEFLLAFSRGERIEILREKLEQAKREISTAINLFTEGPGYRQLLQQIEKGLSDIFTGRLTS